VGGLHESETVVRVIWPSLMATGQLGRLAAVVMGATADHALRPSCRQQQRATPHSKAGCVGCAKPPWRTAHLPAAALPFIPQDTACKYLQQAKPGKAK
jgi:hypothetical protein